MSKWLPIPPNGCPPMGTVALVAVKGVSALRINEGRFFRFLDPDAKGWCEVQEEVRDVTGSGLKRTGRYVSPSPVLPIDDVSFKTFNGTRAGAYFRFALKDGSTRDIDASDIPAHWKGQP